MEFGVEIMEIFQSLFLYNPKSNPSEEPNILQDKQYKIMIACQFVELVQSMRRRKVVHDKKNLPLVQKILKVAQGAFQLKYIHFLIPYV